VVTTVGGDHYANFRSWRRRRGKSAGSSQTCRDAGSPSSMPTTRMSGACASARVRV
jgi:hypothetical protein